MQQKLKQLAQGTPELLRDKPGSKPESVLCPSSPLELPCLWMIKK